MNIAIKRVAVALACAAAMTAQWAPKRAPGFCLIDTTGQWRDLADYRGKPVVLEFMQTTCGHCAGFTEVLIGLQKKYGDRMQILTIALPDDTPQKMLAYANGHKITFPLLYDMGQVTQSYVRGPSLNFPTVYLIDGDGMLRNHWEYGPLAKDIFEGAGLSREIDKLLAPAASAAPKKK
jgi:peroxiredoxin